MSRLAYQTDSRVRRGSQPLQELIPLIILPTSLLRARCHVGGSDFHILQYQVMTGAYFNGVLEFGQASSSKSFI